MPTADYWVKQLELLPHPEGGYYKETYRSKESLPHDSLPKRFKGNRNASTAIYFLLGSKDRSCFHKIKSDEIWHFYAGSALNIYVLTKKELIVHTLGNNVAKGESLQIVIPANCWFGAKVKKANTYALAGCTVSPGFDFSDFKMAKRDALLKEFPLHRKVIDKLSND